MVFELTKSKLNVNRPVVANDNVAGVATNTDINVLGDLRVGYSPRVKVFVNFRSRHSELKIALNLRQRSLIRFVPPGLGSPRLSAADSIPSIS